MTAHSDPHADEATVGPHGSTDDHGGEHGHDDHGHGTDALGPFDLPAWGAGLLGLVLGIVVVIAFVQAAS